MSLGKGEMEAKLQVEMGLWRGIEGFRGRKQAKSYL